jgi:peptide/nickel transport system substrate-binding protein
MSQTPETGREIQGASQIRKGTMLTRKDELTGGFLSGRISRRSVVRRALALSVSMPAAAALLAACGSSDVNPTATTGSQGVGASTQATIIPPTTATARNAGTAVSATGSSPSGQAQTAPKKGGTIRAAIQQELAQLDPYISSGRDTTTVALHVWELLYAEDEKSAPVPMLADGHSISQDSMQYTIMLRKGVPFHNGNEMKAGDVVASLMRWGAMSSLIGQPTFKGVSSVSAKDDYTVIISLKQPSGALLSALSSPSSGAFIMPKEIAEKYPDKPVTEYIGTGPYVLKQWVPQQRARLERFDNYAARSETPSGYAGRRTAYFDAIEIVPVTEDAARLVGLESGDYDLADFLPNDNYDQVSKESQLRAIIWKPASGHARTILNTKSGPMSDLRMRQAVNAAFPPQPVMEAFGPSQFWRVNPSLMNEGQAYYSDAGKDIYLEYDTAKAKQLLSEAGYKGETLKFITSKATDYYYTLSVVVADYMKKVGMNVDLQVRDWATYLDLRDKHPEAWDLIGSGSTVRSDPSQLPMITNSGYSGFWTSQKRDELVQKMNSLTDFKQRHAAWEDVQTLYWNDLPSIKLGDILQYRAAQKSVQAEGSTLELVFLVLWNTWKQ